MLKWALIFLVTSMIAGILGFVALVGVAAALAQILFFVLIAITVVSFLLSLETKRPAGQ